VTHKKLLKLLVLDLLSIENNFFDFKFTDLNGIRDNFNSVVAESGVFLPANENLTRKPETKKKNQIHAMHLIFSSATAYKLGNSPHILSPTRLRRTLPPPKDERCRHPKAAAQARTSEKISHR
jgi:hypothetical protein